jgi:integrase
MPAKRVKVAKGLYHDASAGTYSALYVGPDGKQHLQKLAGARNKTEAVQAQTQLLARLGRGEVVTPTKLTLTDVRDEWWAQLDVKPRTRDAYEYHWRLNLSPMLGQRRVQDLRPQDAAALVQRLQSEGKSGGTISCALQVLSAILTYATWAGYVQVNIVSQLPRNRRPKLTKKEYRLLTADELDLILAQLLDRTYYGPTFLAAWTGLRCGEVLGLMWGDVDLREATVTVRAQLDRTLARVTTKNGLTRTVHLSPKVVAYLKQHREEAMAQGLHRDTDYVFVTMCTGRPIRARNLTQAFTDAAEHVGVNVVGQTRVTFHALRHRFASILISNSCDAPYVAEQIGDTIATTLSTYAHLFSSRSQRERGIAALEAAEV